MKTELMNIPGKGICIVISDINPNEFVFGGDKPFFGGGIFSDIIKITNHLRNGAKISAIKEVREQTGWGLKEAKEYIDKYTPMGFQHNDNTNMINSQSADNFMKDHMPKDFIGDEFSV